MEFKDFRIPMQKYKHALTVQPFDVPAWSESEVDLTFEYAKGAEQRKIRLSLCRQEAQALVKTLTEFLDDDWSEEPNHD